jgi:hypothetical protein
MLFQLHKPVEYLVAQEPAFLGQEEAVVYFLEKAKVD